MSVERLRRPLSAILIACGVAGLSLTHVESQATASPAVAPMSVGTTALIDPHQRGQLVMQFQSPRPFDDEPGPSHIGIPVEIKRVVGIDLTTQQGWQEAVQLTTREVLSLPAERFTDHRFSTSDHTGKVSFTDLPLGLWVVVSPQGRAPHFEAFVVTIPRTSPDRADWQYSYTVYPKISGKNGGLPIVAPPMSPLPSTPPDKQPPAGSDTPPAPTPATSPPGSGAGPEASDSSKVWRSRLAETGADVLGFLAVGGLMTLLGLVLLRRRPSNNPPATSVQTPQDLD